MISEPQPMPNTLSASETTELWWLAVDGRPEGPRSTQEIIAALDAGRISATSMACLHGESEWKPLAAWPTLAELVGATISPPTVSPLPPRSLSHDDRLLTNESLPRMANLICIYAIVVVPLYWMFGFAMLLREDNPFLDETGGYLAYGVNLFFNQVVTSALTIALANGGIRLRELRASGERLIRLVLCVWSAWIVMQIFVFIGFMIIGGVTETFDDSSGDVSPWDVFQLFSALAAWCCDIVAAIWLFRSRGQLPLDFNR